MPPIDQIHYYSPGKKRRVRHSTGGSSCSESDKGPQMSSATLAANKRAIDLLGSKMKKPFSLSKVLRPPGIEFVY